MHEASLIIRYGGNGHEQEYTVSLPGLIGARGDIEIPERIARDLQRRLPGRELANRGSRLEILGTRDDDYVVRTVTGYFDELRQYSV